MKKLTSLRNYLREAVPYLKENPDKLLVFIESGSLVAPPRSPSLSFQYTYTATIIITDFAEDPDKVMVPLIAWMSANQPQRGEEKAADFQAEVLDNDSVDLEIKVALNEFVKVTDNGNGTVSTDHKGEPIYVGDTGSPADGMDEWLLNG